MRREEAACDGRRTPRRQLRAQDYLSWKSVLISVVLDEEAPKLLRAFVSLEGRSYELPSLVRAFERHSHGFFGGGIGFFKTLSEELLLGESWARQAGH